MIPLPLTPVGLQRAAQAVFALALVGATVAMVGPFQGHEATLGLGDTSAHAIAFYGLTVSLFLCAPRSRRLDLALVILGFGLAIEIVQGQTGRSMSLSDLAANALGVVAACLPGAIERLRHHVRTNPDATFAELAASDRRQPRSLAQPVRVVRYMRIRPSAAGNRRPAGRR